jgi:hypothetical protein
MTATTTPTRGVFPAVAADCTELTLPGVEGWAEGWAVCEHCADAATAAAAWKIQPCVGID